MIASDAQKRATAKYKKENMVNKTISLYKKGDADILTHLETKKSFSGYVKELIRKDIEKDAKNK